MAARIVALVCLCLAFIAHAKPVKDKLPLLTHRPAVVHEASRGLQSQLHGGGVEGDMVFPKGFDPKSSTRGAAIYGNKKWPNNIIPCDLSAITDPTDQQTIVTAMYTLMYDVATPKENTNDRSACVYFRPREAGDNVYLKAQYGQGCSANVGYMTQQQPVMTLQKNSGPDQEGCFHSQVIQHELMHVLGFYHEQSRPDRDNYLTIDVSNVEPNMVHNFNKYVWGSTVLNQGSPYDYQSVMHYGTTAFSMNGLPTMIPRQSGVSIGDALRLSPIDIAEVRHYYGCNA
jgi:hypothetical protein